MVHPHSPSAGALIDLPPEPNRLRTGERRNFAARNALVRRVYGEFSDMPGLCLTLPQAIRLFGVREDICIRVLGALSAEGRLRRTPEGLYVRAEGTR